MIFWSWILFSRSTFRSRENRSIPVPPRTNQTQLIAVPCTNSMVIGIGNKRFANRADCLRICFADASPCVCQHNRNRDCRRRTFLCWPRNPLKISICLLIRIVQAFATTWLTSLVISSHIGVHPLHSWVRIPPQLRPESTLDSSASKQHAYLQKAQGQDLVVSLLCSC